MERIFGPNFYWKELEKFSKQIKIYVTHVSGHATDKSPTTLHNAIADQLAKGIEPDQQITILDRTKSLPVKLTFKQDEDSNYFLPPIPSIKLKKHTNGKYKIDIPTQELTLPIHYIQQIHSILGHLGHSVLIN